MLGSWIPALDKASFNKLLEATSLKMISFFELMILSFTLIYWNKRVTSFSNSISRAVAFLSLSYKLLIFFSSSTIWFSFSFRIPV